MKGLAHIFTHALSMRSLAGFAISATFVLAMCCGTVFAQSGAGSIQGTIKDSTEAVIPGASVRVLNTATGVATGTKSNGVGFYQVPGLFTGNYKITVTAPGMQTFERTIDLLVAQNAVINFSMKAGSVSQKVEVYGNAVQLVTTDNGTISSTLENKRINQLPMNGRNILTLVQDTTPGLEDCAQSSSCPNGLMGGAMNYVADGVTLSAREFGGTHTGQSQMPDPDSIQEVRVETDGSGAEFSTPATGIITTKSGTNQLHGSFFETARNSAFGIARSRSNPSDFVAPHYVRNEFGASAGGPIVIPHIYNGKNKSFWFFAYERYSLASNSYANFTVPTMAMRKGDFSGLYNSAGQLQQLYDPATTTYDPAGGKNGAWPRQAFANNQIPISRESPTAKILMDITPQPSNGNNPMVASNLAGADPKNVTTPSITFRLDHVFNEDNRAYLRYTQNSTKNLFLRKSNEPPTLAADGLPYAASGIADDETALYAPAIGFTHIFSPTFFSQTIVSQQWFGEQNYAGGTPSVDFEKKLGLPNNFGEPGFPQINSIFSKFDGTQFQYGMTQRISTIEENLTKTVGRHQLLFGGRYRHERLGTRPDQIKDSISFDGQDTALEDPTSGSHYSATPNTGNANADEFLGAASSYSVHLEPPYENFHDNEVDAYLQDNYRMRENLTLNIGLRYEAHPAIAESKGMMLGFDLKNDAVVTAATPAQLIAEGETTQAIITNDEYDGIKFETPAQAGYPSSTLVRNNDFTWGPRVGFAWLPFGTKEGTVLRGAYGRFIYPEPIRSSYLGINRNNPFTASYGESYTSASQSPDGLPNYLVRANQPVTMGVNSAGVVDSGSTRSILPGISIDSLDPDLPPNYVTQADFTIEQPMADNSALRVSYLYTHGTNLDQVLAYNDHPSTYNWEMETGTLPPTGHTVGSNQYSSTATGPYDQTTYSGSSTQVQKSGWSNYNALQVNYQRLYRHGYAWQISYVWSKSMRVGGDSSRDGEIDPYANYVDSGAGVMTPSYGPAMAPILPPAPPANTPSWAYYHSLDRFENYMVDTGSPKQHLQFNGIIDLPFGQGKWLLGNAGRALNELVGGWQLAGIGSVTSQDFTITDTNWGPTHPLKVYKHKVPITDCRSGVCHKAYEWFNGYIPPTAIAGNACATSGNVVSGLPSNWAPYQTPIDNTCGTKYYGKNEVDVTLATGKTSAVAYQPYPTSNNNTGVGSGSGGANPYSHTVLNGPMNYNVDLSLFKVFPITHTVNLRVNVDAFNALNVQGYTNPDSTTGIEEVEPGGVGASSYNTPRQIQLTARLTF